MDWLEKAIKTVKGALGFKDTSKPTQQCPLKKTGLIVVVLREDTRRPIEAARVNLTGPANQSKPTDKDGLAQFRMLMPANYTIRVALPDRIKDDFEPIEPEMEHVGEETCPVHIIHVRPLAELKVKVIARGKDKNGLDQDVVLEGVQVQITGPATKSESTPKDALGWANFLRLNSGSYQVKSQSLGAHAQKYAPPAEASVDLTSGSKKEVTLIVEPLAWIEFLVMDASVKPPTPIRAVAIHATLADNPSQTLITKDDGVSRAEKLLPGEAKIERMESNDKENNAWEFVSLS
jgi:hypothetical protein